MANARIQLAKLKASQAASATRRRLKSNNLENMLVRQAAGVATGVTLGVMQRNGVANALGAGPDADDKGFPWKPLIGGVALVGAAMTKGAVSAAFEGVSIGANAVYANRATVDGTLIAGTV
jgi:hypothetical protein